MCSICPTKSLTISRRALLRGAGVAIAAPALGGCERIAPLLVSDEVLDQLGNQTWVALTSKLPASRDQWARKRVANIASRLLKVAGQEPFDWEVRVFASPQANAFVLPGRKMGVFEGMVRLASSDGELAAVIGHEIGHFQADHSRERVSAEVVKNWGMQMVSLLLQVNDVAFGREMAALLGIGLEFGLSRPYSRRQEIEADKLGIVTMASAGYDPRAAVNLWRQMAKRPGQGGPAILSTHPAPRARIRAIEEAIQTIPRPSMSEPPN